MSSLPVLFVCGGVGGLLFDHFKLPGGAMTGSMIAVVLFNTFGSMLPSDVPHAFELLIYICIGVIVGNMYKPGMLLAVRDTWPTLVLSTSIVLSAGFICTYIVAKSGVLGVNSAYLATSPGGLSAVMGLASEMGNDAPVVLVYHLVRLYAILLIAPYLGKAMQFFMK